MEMNLPMLFPMHGKGTNHLPIEGSYRRILGKVKKFVLVKAPQMCIWESRHGSHLETCISGTCKSKTYSYRDGKYMYVKDYKFRVLAE